jgi:hypothetical protein
MSFKKQIITNFITEVSIPCRRVANTLRLSDVTLSLSTFALIRKKTAKNLDSY